MTDWTTGYTQDELDAAQERFGLRFPPDLVALFRERRPLRGYDWRRDCDAIARMLRWPLEMLLDDLESNDFWLPAWGERPAAPEARAHRLTALVTAASPLIPLIAHRFLPAEPHAAGNPVISMYGIDTVYYGANLADYFDREFTPGAQLKPMGPPIRKIPFWSDLIEGWD
jgi:hypothetical protein